MTLFLTSSHTLSWIHKLNPANSLIENLRSEIRRPVKCVMVSSFPDDTEITDRMAWEMRETFEWAGMPFSHFEVLDRRTQKFAAKMLRKANFVILCGGHVPTENRFFHELNLRELLLKFRGVVMGISAGSMNCASTVYAPPELDGEAVDPDYQLYLEGLGFTDLNILPHYYKLKNMRIDGYHLIRDLVKVHSQNHPIYCLPDGSYVCIGKEGTFLFGEAYKVSKGRLRRISRDGECRKMSRSGWFYPV